jgi:hypothetical protein
VSTAVAIYAVFARIRRLTRELSALHAGGLEKVGSEFVQDVLLRLKGFIILKESLLKMRFRI